MAFAHEETAAERAIRKELSRRGLCFRQGEIIAGREVDFFLPDCLLAVEVDGLFHLVPEARARDRTKERLLAGLGIFVMRFSNHEALTSARTCGDRVVDYARAWQNRVKRAATVTGETPIQRGLRAWLARAERAPGQGDKPPRGRRVRAAGGH